VSRIDARVRTASWCAVNTLLPVATTGRPRVNPSRQGCTRAHGPVALERWPLAHTGCWVHHRLPSVHQVDCGGCLRARLCCCAAPRETPPQGQRARRVHRLASCASGRCATGANARLVSLRPGPFCRSAARGGGGRVHQCHAVHVIRATAPPPVQVGARTTSDTSPTPRRVGSPRGTGRLGYFAHAS